MQESHRKGLASHPDPESCVSSRKVAIEALTGAPAGWVLSCEIFEFGVPTPFNKAEGKIKGRAFASAQRTLRSLRPQTCRETPRARTGRSHRCP